MQQPWCASLSLSIGFTVVFHLKQLEVTGNDLTHGQVDTHAIEPLCRVGLGTSDISNISNISAISAISDVMHLTGPVSLPWKALSDRRAGC